MKSEIQETNRTQETKDLTEFQNDRNRYHLRSETGLGVRSLLLRLELSSSRNFAMFIGSLVLRKKNTSIQTYIHIHISTGIFLVLIRSFKRICSIEKNYCVARIKHYV